MVCGLWFFVVVFLCVRWGVFALGVGVEEEVEETGREKDGCGRENRPRPIIEP